MAREVLNYLKQNGFCILALLFLVAYWQSAKDLPLRSTYFPRLIMTYVFIPILLWNIVGSIVDLRKRPGKEALPEGAETSGFDSHDMKKVIGIVLTFLYILLISRLGFYVSSTLYFLSFIFLLNIRNHLKTVLYILLMNGFMYMAFERWLGIQIPRGLLF
ncbi:MAG: tripartite tricarboxylate transporter TctB family protein [candidate division NC10 bacterium]|nr:tripartite tricarboxylate transporter TctB family protein [candidate division NC10 bacterium]